MKESLRLLGFLRPYLGWVALSVLAGVATVVSNIALLGTSAYLIASATLHPSIALLQVAIVGVRFFGLARGIFRYLERLASHSVNFRLLARLRTWFYQSIEPLAPASLVHQQSGDLLNRAIGDIETLENFYVRVVSPVIVAAVVTAGMGLYLGSFSPALGGVLLAGMLFSGLALPLLADRFNRAPGRRWVNARADLSALVVDSIQGLPDLLAFGAEGAATQKIQTASQAGMRAQRRMLWSGAVVGSLNQLFTHLTLWVVLILAIPLVTAASLDGVLLAVLVLITLASFEAVTPLAQAAQFWQTSRQSARRLFEIADEPLPVPEPASPIPAPRSAALQVKDLTFSYAPGLSPTLKGLTFSLAPGKVLAVVGPSGAGKSTLANILLRFWDVDAGRVMLDGRDIRAYTSTDVRRMTALVSQSTYLFNATLRQNLLMASPHASEEALLSVLESVTLGDWLRSLPDGLDTWLGERGLQVSGGERQRLALARALLQDAPLVILDEPTANLDAITESQVLSLLRQVLAGRTVLWITHRLAGLDWADEILVLDDGQLVERGRHAQLLAAGGLYAQMFQARVNQVSP